MADIVFVHKCTFPLGAVILADVGIGVPTSQGLKLRVECG